MAHVTLIAQERTIEDSAERNVEANAKQKRKDDTSGARETSLENNSRGPRFAKKPQRRVVAPLVAEAMEKNWRDFRLTPFRGQWFRDQSSWQKKRETDKEENSKNQPRQRNQEDAKEPSSRQKMSKNN